MSTSVLEAGSVTLTERPTLMKAAVVHSFSEPLRLEEIETPVPGRDEILVRVEASGLCHTDIHAAHGDWPVKPTPPFVPGHEGVGIVVTLGPGVTEVGARRSGGCPVARLRMRDLRALRVGLGDAVHAAAEHRLLGGRRLRRVRQGIGAVRREGAGRRRPARRGAAHLRRRHDLQSGQGLRRSLLRPRGSVRHRRPRSPRGSVRPDRRGTRRRSRHRTTTSSSSLASWARTSR